MRKEFKPDITKAIELYPIVDELIHKNRKCFTDDNMVNEYNELVEKLSRLTGKDYSQCNLKGWFNKLWNVMPEPHIWIICLPHPNIINDFTKIELIEIVKRLRKGPFNKKYAKEFLGIKHYEILFEKKKAKKTDLLVDRVYYAIMYYYYQVLLFINFNNFKNEYFKKKDGKYIMSIDEIVDKLWDR